MARQMVMHIIVLLGLLRPAIPADVNPGLNLASLTKNQQLQGFRVVSLYSDSGEKIVGAKFFHVPSGAPVFLLQIETVPQAYMWVETPVNTDRGLPHALEHLLTQKGTTGRYLYLLNDMRLSRSNAATWRDFNFYGFSSGSGMSGFLELLHAWMQALYYPDFSDAEAEREFYHFSVATDMTTKKKTLTEGGSVYNEELAAQGGENCYSELKKRVLGRSNPLAARIGGDPDQMRNVTANDIRRLHDEDYHLGPTTGFIFIIDPKEDVNVFLAKVSAEFGRVAQRPIESIPPQGAAGKPKYPMYSSDDNEPQVCAISGANEAAPSDIWFAWKPQEAHSMMDLKLLELFFRGLADGQRSLLYRSLVDRKTRGADFGVTSVSHPASSESPRFLLSEVYVSGIPGNRLSIDKISRVRDLILAKIIEISQYPDHSAELANFNDLISSYAQAWHRSKQVWMRNSPQFGVILDANWKDFLDYLEMDPSFVHSLSEDKLWEEIERELGSGKNIWRDIVRRFDLLNPPYASATQASPQLLQKLEQEKQQRISSKIKSLEEHYNVTSDRDALAQFEHDELVKTEEIHEIQGRVPKVHFTKDPPLTWDDNIRYTQFQISGVSTVAALPERPPTLEIGLAFDLNQIPSKYYKYLPILARCFDAVGLKEGSRILPYSDMLSETRSRFVEFSAGTAANGVSHRAELTLRASVTSIPEFRQALRWMDRVLFSNFVDIENASRLRDIVAERLTSDDSYTKQGEQNWVFTPALAFRFQSDPLYLALESPFTKAHWDGRLRWLLHEPVTAEQISRLDVFASQILSESEKSSRLELGKRFKELGATGIEGELVDYWERNINSFPEGGLVDGLKRLTLEVEDDLRVGPAKTIDEIRDLQRIVINRQALHMDLLASPAVLNLIKPDLAKFIKSIPDRPLPSAAEETYDTKAPAHPITDKLIRENKLAEQQFPWYLGLVIPDEFIGNAIFYSDFVPYSQTDQGSLLRFLASGILAGRGPGSLYMKSREAGLAYGFTMRADPVRGLLSYYADRSLDVPSLVSTMKSAAAEISNMKDPFLVDYAFRQAFPINLRSIYEFSLRERLLSQDIRDGNPPMQVRAFNRSLLRLREHPNLLSELTEDGKNSLCGILLEQECVPQQRAAHSIFFFVGSEKILSDIEKSLPKQELVRVWPSDYWLDLK